jgi:hypothetical protein
VLLPIQKSAAKNCDAADLEIHNNGGVISDFNLLLLFSWVFTINIIYVLLVGFICI